MRRAIPTPHVTHRRALWRAGAGVLALTTAVSVIEGLTAADGLGMVVATNVFPAVGAVVAALFGARLRPAVSFRVGQLFLVLGTLSAAMSVYSWRGSVVGGAMGLHYVMVILFAAIGFDRRDVYQQIGLIAVAHAAVLSIGGPSMIALLVWTLTMLPVVAVGLVLHKLVQILRAESTVDALTGAANRRSWDSLLDVHVREHVRHGRPLSVLLVDLDHFKSVNDTRGHEAGDEVLRRAVELWRPLVRASDIVARLGGDEFALLLPGCGGAPAVHVGSLLVAALREDLGVTCSVGIATGVGIFDGPSLIAEADRRLYAAKAAGRACVRDATVDRLSGEQVFGTLP